MEDERRKYLLNQGNKNEHSHLIIIVDRSDYIPEEITRYVKRDEDIKDILFQYICNPNLEIWNIYNYDMDLEIQINESKPYHVVAPYNKMNEAYNFAKQKHEGQVRRNGNAISLILSKLQKLSKIIFQIILKLTNLLLQLICMILLKILIPQ